MYQYMIGTITEIEASFITLEVGKIGYMINTPNPYAFEVGKEYCVYLYQHIREDEESLFGFKTKEEKELFLKLIGVKGLGPKMALPILATGSIQGIMDAIERENLLYLKKFPKIGDKLAKQMVLDLKGKLDIVASGAIIENHLEELIEVLKGLGYKEKDFKGILPKVDQNLSIEEQVKEALKLLLK